MVSVKGSSKINSWPNIHFLNNTKQSIFAECMDTHQEASMKQNRPESCNWFFLPKIWCMRKYIRKTLVIPVEDKHTVLNKKTDQAKDFLNWLICCRSRPFQVLRVNPARSFLCGDSIFSPFSQAWICFRNSHSLKMGSKIWLYCPLKMNESVFNHVWAFDGLMTCPECALPSPWNS